MFVDLGKNYNQYGGQWKTNIFRAKYIESFFLNQSTVNTATYNSQTGVLLKKIEQKDNEIIEKIYLVNHFLGLPTFIIYPSIILLLSICTIVILLRIKYLRIQKENMIII